jgi:hypothetical protein
MGDWGEIGRDDTAADNDVHARILAGCASDEFVKGGVWNFYRRPGLEPGPMQHLFSVQLRGSCFPSAATVMGPGSEAGTTKR